VAQLYHVPEQDQAVEGAQRGTQRGALTVAAQDVRAPAGAEVQVGDDQRAQRL
jgi:hypothetical protein